MAGCNSKEDEANYVGHQAIELVRKHKPTNDEPSVGEAQVELHDFQVSPHSMVHGLDLRERTLVSLN